MTKSLDQFMESCVADIRKAHEEGVTMEEAERLAAKFLTAQIEVGNRLCELDLDARMRKSGVKAIRAAVYLEHATKGDKKPSDVMLEAIVNTNKLVQDEQTALDKVEVQRDNYYNYAQVFREAHIFMRGISKGRYE